MPTSDPSTGTLTGPPDVRSGSTPSQSGVPIFGREHITRILTSANGNVDATAGGTELFTSPHLDRRQITFTNTHATATNYLYVLITGSAGTPAISATVYRKRLGGSDDPWSVPCGPDCRVFVFGVAGNTSYVASEESWANA